MTISEDTRTLIENHFATNRVSVNPATSNLISDVHNQLKGGTINEILSGSECLSWIIPHEWTVQEAYVESPDGQKIIDFEDNPLHLKSYSSSFEGTLTREELIEHLHSNKEQPERIPYHYQWQFEDGRDDEWGFSVSHSLVESLPEGSYFVKLDTTFSRGEMSILDHTIKGSGEKTIFFSAHTCHPAQLNDGLINICILVELFKWLEEHEKLRHNYRLFLGPEYFTGAAVLDHLVEASELDYGFYLDMMANGESLGFSKSYHGDSYADRITRVTLSDHVDDYFERDYRQNWGNDELFYDGPDFEIPTVQLGRDYFENYHTDADNIENCDFTQVDESLEFLKELISTFEKDYRPERSYKGPLYFSGYDLDIGDIRKELSPFSEQHLQREMDGSSSLVELSDKFDLSLKVLKDFCNQLANENLIHQKY